MVECKGQSSIWAIALFKTAKGEILQGLIVKIHSEEATYDLDMAHSICKPWTSNQNCSWKKASRSMGI